MLVTLVDDVEGRSLVHIVLDTDLSLVGNICALKFPIDETLLRAEYRAILHCLLAETLTQPIDCDNLNIQPRAEVLVKLFVCRHILISLMSQSIDALAQDRGDLLRDNVRREVRYDLVRDHCAHNHGKLGGLGI